MSKAMAAGVPQLILPLAYDQLDNAIRVRRLGAGVLLEPASFDVTKFFEAIDACGAVDFMSEGRQQPKMPAEKLSFD